MFAVHLVATAAASPVSPWVDLEWRALALAAHPSHGPGFGIGVSLLDDHLQLGLAGFTRPGPWNPATFEVRPTGEYKGRETLSLRSDGGITGLMIAPGTQVGGVELDLPVSVGYGGFGFYLAGEDRVTPDGRKPSAWENELLDGRDSSFGLSLDAGVRVRVPTGAGLDPYVAARWSTIVGYDAFVRDAYGGPSIALGVQLRPTGGPTR
ncbi:MAG: hypothetical protein ABMA64_00885 [Myxococcota bacterium]